MTELFKSCLIRDIACQSFDKVIASLVFVHANFTTRKKGVILVLETLNNLFDGFLVARLNKFIIQPASQVQSYVPHRRHESKRRRLRHIICPDLRIPNKGLWDRLREGEGQGAEHRGP